jgi:hypothetical protein
MNKVDLNNHKIRHVPSADLPFFYPVQYTKRYRGRLIQRAYIATIHYIVVFKKTLDV